ncbi:tRNA (adenosine(37)-N6)-threonylcarbamoyltransferase complex transferase subunit TsaD [Aciditerrimonas ferrireducens]|uniref:tRNA (adenosine(37)-N6)-threonylcarbamoyltransferase complex transferase subunit TsaD n=1 Tax=Aciditerrimonas ferrireducens TaxID=667306 RepID=UPI0020029F30|nr:tRNA (adenosine(37)-N6)-threonylcarbamoyltransferase complex transferase subunit TsaD [Aciditerrimonas ferrireducens]MCK4176148.1 tRNA (adenosine(37)-N6)-threonylcarbamoyltransferase complex transferase subunit TsaD [Aciditerrimonas ferrireducens]
MLVLGIETSCDETAAAVVDEAGTIRSSVVSSQVDVHARYGGVVPELASRAHLALLPPVVGDALHGAGLGADPGRAPVDVVAATVGPGLVGALLVGSSLAKGLAMAWDVPFVGVNHLEGHCFAALLDHPELRWPVVVVLVSGGHTMLLAMDGPGRYRLLGQTLDDAAGEAFDKVARFLGLGYPGGPAIERTAKAGDPTAFAFPRALLDQGFDLSFSGLKTAVVRAVRARPDASDADVAASFQQAVVDVLVAKGLRAAEAVGASGICLAGGVAANGALRAAFADACAAKGLALAVPSRAMCTDNAAMVAAAGAWQLTHLGPSPLDQPAEPGAGLPLERVLAGA